MIERVEPPTLGTELSHMNVRSLGVPMAHESVESIELFLLLEALDRLYGYDFRDYNQLSLLRRVEEFVAELGLPTMLALLDCIVDDSALLERLLLKLTVNVTQFFRNPAFFRAFRSEIVPMLAERDFIRIWHAGCATGEEVYSAAIVLLECGLLDRTRIYATDLNREALHWAQAGAFSHNDVNAAEVAYGEAGGEVAMRSYGTMTDDAFVLDPAIRQRIVFAQHDLVKDGRFNEFDVIFSRNVLVHFNETLQERALSLYTQSLLPEGFLGMGERETALFSSVGTSYSEVGKNTGFYRLTRSTTDRPNA